MTEYRSLIEREIERVHPRQFPFEELTRRRERKRRNQRVGAALVALAIAIIGVGLFLRTVRFSENVPADRSVTVENVANLGVAWSGSAPGDGRFANIRAADGMVFATSFEGHSGALLAFPQRCATICDPTWHARIGCCENMPDGPLAMAGMVFVAEGDTLYAFDERCGSGGASCSPSWRGVVPGAVLYQPVGADGVVYVGSGAGHLSAWKAGCGDHNAVCAPLWTSKAQGGPLQASAVVDDRVYVGSLDNRDASNNDTVYVFPAVCTDGCEPIARTRLPLDVASRPVASGDVVLVANGDLDGPASRAIAYPASCAFQPGCRPLWQGTLPGRANMPDPIVSGDVAFFASTGDDFVRAFSVTCDDPCSPLWTGFAFEPSMNEPVAVSDLLYLPSTTEGLVIYPIDCTTHGGVCDPVWRSADLEYRSVSAVAVDDGQVFIRTTDGQLIALAPGAQRSTG